MKLRILAAYLQVWWGIISELRCLLGSLAPSLRAFVSLWFAGTFPEVSYPCYFLAGLLSLVTQRA